MTGASREVSTHLFQGECRHNHAIDVCSFERELLGYTIQEWFTPGNLDLRPSQRSFSQGTMFNVDTDPV